MSDEKKVFRRDPNWKPKVSEEADLKYHISQFPWKFTLIIAVIALFIGLLTFPSLIARHHKHEMYAGANIVLYGRTGCSLTAKGRAMLDDKDIPYTFKEIDKNMAELRGLESRLVIGPGGYSGLLPYFYYKGKLYEGPYALSVIDKLK